MELVLVGVVGLVIGFLLGRTATKRTTAGEGPTTVDRLNRSLSRRQQKILATLPPDEPRPTIEDLIAEEAAELGIDEIPADPTIPLAVKLQVFRRDAGGLGTADPAAVAFRLAAGTAEPIEAADVRLIARSEQDS